VRQQGKIDRALKVMSEELGNRNWCSGDHYSLADIAVGCALGYLDMRLPDTQWRRDYQNLEKLAEKLNKRPSFVDSAPPKS
jgi:glutathione S-transferase